MCDDYHLRELTHSDLPAINRWRNDPAIVTSLCAPFRYINIETDEEWFASYQRNRSTQVRLVIATAEEQPVGLVNLLQIDAHAHSAEFSMQIGEQSCWGKGLGKWATNEAVRHGFFNLNLHRIALAVLPDNQKARKIYSNIGFRDEGVLRQALFKDGGYKDLILMGLLRHEYVNGDR